MLGGGSPIAKTTPNVAWAASYGENGIIDTSSIFPSHVTQPGLSGSSILSIYHAGDRWIFGGYSDCHAILLIYAGESATDISNLVSGMSYVIWVGAKT